MIEFESFSRGFSRKKNSVHFNIFDISYLEIDIGVMKGIKISLPQTYICAAGHRRGKLLLWGRACYLFRAY